MKVPDTIYVAVYPDDDGINTHLGDWYSEPEYRAQDNIEYVRKDALLELIKEESSFWDDGEMIFRTLIDKINEM